MGKKSIFIMAASLLTAMIIQAQDNLHLSLNNGSELTGYISRQKPGENFSFASAEATMSIDGKDVTDIVERKVSEIELPEAWKKWAEANDAFITENGNKYLVLSDIKKKNGQIPNVRLLERGAKIKYLDLGDNVYNIAWDDIDVIKADPRSKQSLSGIDRKYKLKNGVEYQGQYISEVPGQTISLYQQDGVTRVFNYYDVIKDNRVAINPNQPMIEQTDLLDIVELKNGTSIKGFIFERNYSESANVVSDYLLIMLEDGSSQSIPFADISEYRKERNPKFNQIFDIVLNPGEIAINRNIIQPVKLEESEGVLFSETLNEKGIDCNGSTLVVEAKLKNPSEAYQLRFVPVDSYTPSKKKSYKGTSYKDLVKKALPPINLSTNINGITRIEYPITLPGEYIIYNPITSEAYPLTIIPNR